MFTFHNYAYSALISITHELKRKTWKMFKCLCILLLERHLVYCCCSIVTSEMQLQLVKRGKSIWKVNVLKFVATNKCNLDIKSSLHFPQFCYCFSFLALLDFKTTFIWIILYLSFQRVLRVYNFYRKEGKVVSISACPPPRVTGRRLWCQYCWCLIRSEDGGRVASGGSGVDTTAVPDSTGKWQSGN